jgi:hypothetical protein
MLSFFLHQSNDCPDDVRHLRHFPVDLGLEVLAISRFQTRTSKIGWFLVLISWIFGDGLPHRFYHILVKQSRHIRKYTLW